MKKILVSLGLIFFIFSLVIAPSSVSAFNFSTGGSGWNVSIGSGTQYGTWSTGMYSGLGLPGGTIFGILTTLLLWALGIFGIVAIIAFIIAGIIYLTSAGDENMAARAKRAMTYAIIGVIVGLSGWIIIIAINAALSSSNTMF